MPKNWFIGGVMTVFVVALVWQQRALRALQSDLARVSGASVGITANQIMPSTSNVPVYPRSASFEPDGNPILERLSRLEAQVRQLTIAWELLMAKGWFPLSETMVAQLKSKFRDTSLPDRERLEALRVLRANNAVDDEILQSGLAWVDALSDPRTVRDVLEQFTGLKQPVLRDKFLQLVTQNSDAQVRQQAAAGLAGLVDDPAVDSVVWKALATEQNSGVQAQLENALRDGPMTPARQAELQRRTLNKEATFRERLTAFRAMTAAKVADPQTTATFANEVVAQDRAEDMAVLFRALDNTGNLAAAPALIKGLQVAHPEMRALALDALSEMQSDATVVTWLKFVANNDTDARVRAEAIRVLAQAGNKP